MSSSLKAAQARTHANVLQGDLQDLRAGSHNARMTVNPSVARESARVAMDRTGLSQKAMAITAGIPESVLSDALNGRGRNLETDWLLAQSGQFIAIWLAEVQQRLGLTPDSRAALRAARIGELVRLLCEATA